MPAATIDSNVLIAFASTRDRHHDDAHDILTSLDHGELPTGTVTNYVAAETLGFLNERQQHEVAVDLYSRLKSSSGFEIVHCTRDDFTTAETLFEQHPELSFVDATIVAYARRAGRQYLYSFDDDFDGLDGITRLRSAVDPYD